MDRTENKIMHLRIASYPGSGVAWLLNFFLELNVGIFANYAKGDGVEGVWGKTTKGYVLKPEAEVLRAWLPILSKKNYFHFRPDVNVQWSHELPREENTEAKIILIVRDGRDVLYSEYKRFWQTKTLEDFLQSRSDPFDIHYPHFWALFNYLWLKSIPHERLHILRFEDIKSTPLAAMQKLLSFLHIPSPVEEIQHAIEESQFEKARAAEERFKKSTGASLPIPKINRRGTPGEWKENFSDTALNLFHGFPNEMLATFGYEVKSSVKETTSSNIHPTVLEEGIGLLYESWCKILMPKKSNNSAFAKHMQSLIRTSIERMKDTTSLMRAASRQSTHQGGTENVYGHKKRLLWMRKAIATYAHTSHTSGQNLRILDVGCGTGNMVTRPLGEEGYTITGIDIDFTSIEAARERNILDNVTFVHGNLEDLQTDPFDVIMCSEVLEHVSDPAFLLQGIAKHLKDTGIVLLTVPNGYGWFEFEKFLYDKLHFKKGIDVLSWIYRHLGIKKIRDRMRTIPESTTVVPHTLRENDIHLQHFTQRSLKKIFTATKFIIVEKRNSTAFSGPLTGFFLHSCEYFLRLNARLADSLPSFLGSGWYFILKKRL